MRTNKPKPHPQNPTLYLSLSLGWLLFLPFYTLEGPIKIAASDAAKYFTDPTIAFEIQP